MQLQKKFFWSGGLLLILFVIFSGIVRLNYLNGFDYEATMWLQAHISKQWDTIFSVFSVLGTIDVTSVVLLIIILFNRNRNAIYFFVSFCIISLAELYGKYFIPHPSPPTIFARYVVFFTYPSDYLPQPPSSYPSGHAGRTLLLTGILFFLILRMKRLTRPVKTALILLLVIYDCILLVSRVTLGEHWTTDVIGGSILGLAMVCFNGGFLMGSNHHKKASSREK